MSPQPPEPPEHLTEAAQAVDELRTMRHRQLPPAERSVQAFLDAIARPRFVLVLVVSICVWVSANALARAAGHAFDDSAYNVLNLVATLISLVLVVAILSGQRTNNTLEQERARLMLQLMIVHDRKITEALNGVEDLRRVDPRVPDPEKGDLHEETDLHEAARALREAEGADSIDATL